ncbi:mevalonate kinase [Candidatus Woesebacteria bacterium RBG_13_34_9]|uniref:mevalonate kinase n=1 Tax=Candidatus Woesebacteria bacterium RBG_13_34_9 TaxID=1802477 RepID=A0A1F7X2Z0_9BACT|nr:MAG: mevalonate kinase [Candidatus Woesebacteria bacterium RBG_13_34_9]
MKTCTSASGKIILSGEHAVVYGFPALVTAINCRAKVFLEENNNGISVYPSFARIFILAGLKRIEKILKTEFRGFNLYIDSKIPVGSGMGSSAAIAVCLSAAILHYKKFPLDLERINELAYEMEKINHGKPSGVDNAVSTYGGFLWFRKESEKFKIFSKVVPEKKLPKLLIVDSGKPEETTRDMVFLVSEKYKRHPKKVEKIFLRIEDITKAFLQYILNEKKLVLRELIKENERLLEELGVVSDSTKALIKEIEKLGGAAKISGAGGRKTNSGVVITYHQNNDVLLDFAKKKNLKVFPVRLGMKGVKIEKDKI